MATVPQLDPFAQAHEDGRKAVATFLPSLVAPKNVAPQAPPKALPHSDLRDAVRAMSLANHVEQMSSRVANGLPATPPQVTPEEQFGNQLDAVHTRAISAAIAAHPETERARLISEAHDSASKWIMSHNGKVIVHGKVELAHDPKTAQNLAAKIVNGTVEDHDAREEAKQEAANPDNSPSPAGLQARPDASPRNTSGETPSNVPRAPLGSKEPQTGRPITHSSPDLPTAQAKATAVAPKFHRMLEAGTKGVKGARVAGVRDKKDASRARQKEKTEGKPPNTQTDLLAGRIAVDSPEAKDQVVQNLKDQAPVIDESNQFQQGDPDYGFRSHTLQTQVSPDTSAEVQVVPKEIDDVNDTTHQTYEAGRAAEASGDDDTAQAAMDENKSAHDDAMDAFNQRNADKSQKIKDVLASAGVKITGEPIKLGGHTFLPIQNDAEEAS